MDKKLFFHKKIFARDAFLLTYARECDKIYATILAIIGGEV